MTENIIPCSWIKMPKTSLLPEKEKVHKRCGRYHQSSFPHVEGFGTKRWVVCGYIQIKNCEQILDLSENEIVEGCVAFLNKPSPRKRKSAYGNLRPIQAPWRGENKYDVKVIEGNKLLVCLSIDQRKNKNFWYDGQKEDVKADGRKSKNKK